METKLACEFCDHQHTRIVIMSVKIKRFIHADMFDPTIATIILDRM